jgi:hypothetical protein
VAVGDFDSDGNLDLAVANNYSNDMSVLLGNGDGTFQTARTFPAGRAPASVAVGDFNGDGRLDLAGTSFDANVNVFLGNGDGSFQSARNFGVGANPSSVAVGDFNGDGFLDLAVASRDGVTVLLGNGDGSFQTGRNFLAGTLCSAVAVGDVNGDGRLDLIVVFTSGVRVLLGNGDGSFQTPPVSYIVGASASAAAVADLNGDGLPDLAVTDPRSGAVSILLNDGAWSGPSPPPGGGPGGSRFPGTVRRLRAPRASFAVPVEALMQIDHNVSATTWPSAAVGPGGNDSLPLLGSDSEEGGTRAADATVRAAQPLALVLAPADEAVCELLDRLFAAWESGWPVGRSAGAVRTVSPRIFGSH